MTGESLYEMFMRGEIGVGDEIIYRGQYPWRVIGAIRGESDSWWVEAARIGDPNWGNTRGPINDDAQYWEFTDSFKAWVRQCQKEESCQTV